MFLIEAAKHKQQNHKEYNMARMIFFYAMAIWQTMGAVKNMCDLSRLLLLRFFEQFAHA